MQESLATSLTEDPRAMADSVDEELVNNFQAITHASEENARMYLAAADSDLQNAIEMFFVGMQ